MPAFMRVLRRMAIRRVVTTQRRAAGLTRPKMDPLRADLHAFFADPSLRMFDCLDRPYVRASFLSHQSPPLLVEHLMY